jgi:hypothetical protein
MADNTAAFPRGECPHCHQIVALTRDGSRTHRHLCVDPNRDKSFYHYHPSPHDVGDYVAVVEIGSGYIVKGALTESGRRVRTLTEQRRRYFAAAKRLITTGAVSASQVDRPHVECYWFEPKDPRKGMWVPVFVWVSEDEAAHDGEADTEVTQSKSG